MTITIRPLHIAIIGAFLAGILIAAGVAFGLSGGDDSEPDEPTTANLDVTPTASPTSEPSPTLEPTEEPEPTAEPSPEPTSAPEIRTCEEIRADTEYRSPEERTFFLNECTGGDEPTTATASDSEEPAPSSSSSSEATAAETQYRGKAEASLTVFAARIGQYLNTPSYGATADTLEFGTVIRKFAQELDRLPAPPPRFQQVHDQLRGSLLAFADYILTIVDVDQDDEQELITWLNGYFELAEPMLASLDDYALVVGIELPAELAP